MLLKQRSKDERPRRGSWAPGGYLGKCRDCGQHFEGDKRATMCAVCAYSEETEVPSMSLELERLARRYDAHADLCAERARMLRAEAAKFTATTRRFLADPPLIARRLYVEHLWEAIRLLRRMAENLWEGSSNTLRFNDWLMKCVEVRYDDFGDAIDWLQAHIEYRDFVSFHELSAFAREKGASAKQREALAKLFSMWVCWRAEIGINPQPTFYKLKGRQLW